MKFILFCEGATEKKALPTFLKRWLDAQLSQPVGVTPVKFEGWRHLYGDARKKAHLRLREDDVIVEAWLLSAPDLFPSEIRNGFPGRAENPETVNFNEPPARLLNRLYGEKMRRAYKKVTQGKDLFDRLSPEVARNKCPRFAEMLDEITSGERGRAIGL